MKVTVRTWSEGENAAQAEAREEAEVFDCGIGAAVQACNNVETCDKLVRRTLPDTTTTTTNTTTTTTTSTTRRK